VTFNHSIAVPPTFTINPSVLASLDDLSLLARIIVEGFLEGLHRSPFLGYSTEFSAYRAYAPGDDLSLVDWKAWARTDKYYVKQFEDDTNLTCHIFLDTSASMDFGNGLFNKFYYGRLLAAVLAYLMTQQRDAPGLVLFSDTASAAVPPRAARFHADEIFLTLARLQAGGGTQIDTSLLSIVQSISRRGLAVVISDFFAPGDTACELLRHLHAQRQEVIAFQTLSPEELDFPFGGALLLEDSEIPIEKPVHADAFRARYLEHLQAFCRGIKEQCTALEMDYHLLRTDQPLELALIRYLEKRSTC